MLIPNKYSGYQAGIRLYPFGGGGGGGSSQPGMGDSQVGNTGGTTGITGAVVPPPPPYANMAVNTQQGYDTLRSAAGQPWGQSGGQYNDLLTQGFTSNQIRDSAGQMYGAPSNENFNQLVTNAGMTSPTGRPLAGSAQFYQPVQQQQYQNYANPYTAFNVSTYGTQPMMSTAAQYQANTGGNQQNVSNSINNYLQQNPNANMNTMMAAMRGSGMNAYDVQGAGGFNNYGPRMPSPQMQQSFNPFTNNFGGGFGGGYGGGFGGFMPQMQTPFRQPMQQFQMQTPFSQPTNNFGGFGGGFGGGFSGMGRNNFVPDAPLPDGMVGTMGGTGYDPMTGRMDLGTAGGSGQYTPAPLRSSGPSQAIVGRSSQMRGTPNVMRRAEGGIASLMDEA
jgi:hypothetical protein